MAGHRPRILAATLTTSLLTPPTLILAFRAPLWLGASLLSLATFALVNASVSRWPHPARLVLSRPTTTPRGRRILLVGLVVGLALGLAAGLTVGPVAGLTLGFTLGLTAGLTAVIDSGIEGGTDPRDPIRNDLSMWLTYALPAGFAFGLLFGQAAGLTLGLALGLGLAFGLTLGPTAGPVGTRYLMLIACMHGRLPPRLGRFLNWSYSGAGLIRIAGVAYQFRHRELQDYLARHPTP